MKKNISGNKDAKLSYSEIITDIISNSETTDINTKNTLNELFNALYEYTDKQLKNIELKQKNNTAIGYSAEDCINIYTALVEIAEYTDHKEKYQSFSPIASKFGKVNIYGEDDEKDDKDFIGVFFNCDYDKFIEITDSVTFGKDYEVIINKRSYLCQFEVDYTFVAHERILRSLAFQYGINVPVIYSPYARRFARLRLVNSNEIIKAKEIKSIEFREPLLTYIAGTTISHTLIWNVNVVSNKLIPSFSDTVSQNDCDRLGTSSDGYKPSKYLIASQHYKYMQEYKCSKNEFILFDNPNNLRLVLSRNINSDILYVMYNSDEALHSETRITVTQPQPIELQNLSTYQNIFDKGIYLLPRLRTHADISYVVNSFALNPYSLSVNVDDIIISRSTDRNIISDDLVSPYNSYHRYYGRISNEINIKQSSPVTSSSSQRLYCTIPFVGKNNFAKDYIRYVIEFLSYTYPEVLWQATWREQ